MILTCPHDQPLRIENLGGVTCYRHDDDQDFCELMNDFATKIDDISQVYVDRLNYQHEVTPKMKVVLLSSKKARQSWYRILSAQHGDMLKSMLRGTLQVMDTLPSMRDTILDELWTTFGDVVLKNLYNVSDRNIIYPTRNAIIPQNPLPMENLVTSKVLNTSRTIEERKRAKDARIHTALKDLTR